jgi:hypothetical protein
VIFRPCKRGKDKLRKEFMSLLNIRDKEDKEKIQIPKVLVKERGTRRRIRFGKQYSEFSFDRLIK